MYIVDLIPLIFIPRKKQQILSYLSSERLNIGIIVEITINKRLARAVIIRSQPIRNLKLNLRKINDFKLKKINKVIIDGPQITHYQLQLASFIADYYYLPLGIALKTFLLSYSKSMESNIPSPIEHNQEKRIQIIMGSINERLGMYEAIINENSGENKKTLILSTNNTSAKYLLEKYANHNPLLYTTDLTKKNKKKAIEDMGFEEGSKLIIGTRSSLTIDIPNLSTIIIDDYTNIAYKNEYFPYTDARVIAQKIAYLKNTNLIGGGLLRGIEYYNSENSSKLPMLNVTIIDMVKEIKSGYRSHLSENIRDLLKKGSKILFYIPRKGYNHYVQCNNCNYLLECPSCSVPLKLHSDQVLICHKCAYTSPLPKKCPKCQIYGLKGYGVGIEKLKEELEKYFKVNSMQYPILEFDGNTKNPNHIIDNFNKGGNSVLLCTQSVFSYKYLIKTEYSCIINAESLIRLPDFRSEEYFIDQIYNLGSISDHVILQTYEPEHKIFNQILKGNFFEEELIYRKRLKYPPYSNIVKVTYSNKDALKSEQESYRLFKDLSSAVKNLGNQECDILPPTKRMVYKENNNFSWVILLKFYNKNIKLRNELLDVIPHNFKIVIDPTEIM